SWEKCEGENILKSHRTGCVHKICPSLARIDDKVITDIKTFAEFFKNPSMDSFWDEHFSTLKEEEENWDQDEEQRDVLDAILQKTANRAEGAEATTTDIQDLLSELNISKPSNHKPVQIGKISKKHSSNTTTTTTPGTFVMLDMDKYADEWPQVAKILTVISTTETEIRWYKGAKTSTWSPATRRVKGSRGGKTEPFIEIINNNVIWFSGFSLTPSGHLPKQVREEVDAHVD
ncbi:hypothetical protein MAR_021438, partial [Mya arenaria]